MPPFGDIVNTALQVIKSYTNASKGIKAEKFKNELVARLNLTDEQLEIKFLDPTYNDDSEGMYTDAYTEMYLMDNAFAVLIDLAVDILSAIGIVCTHAYPLYPNITHEDFIKCFVPFNKTVTPENLIEIDPFGKIYYWLACKDFAHAINADPDDEKDYDSNLATFANRSFKDIKALNYACYGDEGDKLINHLMAETLRRCSVFMNNYDDVEVTNDYVKATTESLLERIYSLTPDEFELLCIKIVETSLKKDAPNANYECKHVGQANDGGLDGIIIQTFASGETQTYYVQSKLYNSDNKISNHQLRNFVGAFPPDPQFHHGIFMTTSDFTAPAVQYANTLKNHSLILINQLELLDQMQEHEVGVERVQIETLVMNNEFFRRLRK